MSMTGGCLCGAVRFRVDAPPVLVANCHCAICRRAHGAAFGSFAVFPLTAFCWTQGEDAIGVYHSSASFHRHFCRRCGTHLAILEDWNPNGVTLVLAALDEPHDLKPALHIFTGSRAAWYHIQDQLPQHTAWPPGVGPMA